MNELVPMVVVSVVCYFTYKIFELFARRKERMAVIEKLSNGIDPQILKNQFNMPAYKDGNYGSWAIRIGLLLVGVGLGVTIATIVDLLAVAPSSDNRELFYEFRNTISVLYPACAAVFGGLGLVIAYFIENKKENKSKKGVE
ncbi:hypothetical protein JGH11_13515 [Dysgonomonas sp. Marseille-P4677]|uniref:DUF6249 domain-containing protein n=1 Tax=Dysgonomonas sp. Marseille-P4677 TaxID=2364790 RepID=UPI0019127879|nr:DUF6249 domain-containing protein [Dysgonomonas sp. Marseille-P4677]MBK5721892.1 hypothetical protein [Dysgonomonas sp. Marseille-P4677]